MSDNSVLEFKTKAQPDTFLKMADVVKTTTLCRSTIYKKIKEGTFPCARELGPNCVRWLESEVQAWMEAQPLAKAS